MNEEQGEQGAEYNPNRQSVVILLSGGQDSCTVLFWALNTFRTANYPKKEFVFQAVSFAYGQRHKAELDAGRELALLAGIPRMIIPLKETLSWSRSALIDHKRELTDGDFFKRELPSSFVPGRNALFLTIAAAVGYELAPSRIHLVGGMCQTDYSGYPDCREKFIDAEAEALELALDRRVTIWTPLMHLTKAETVRMAKGLPGCYEALAKTVTCYQGQRPGCGECPACKLRAKGFEEAGFPDPVFG